MTSGIVNRVEQRRNHRDHHDPLGLVTSGNPYTMDQKVQDAAARNPRWVPAISSGTGASTSAHVGTRPAGEAAHACSGEVGRRHHHRGLRRAAQAREIMPV